jgi:hypothetical protein
MRMMAVKVGYLREDQVLPGVLVMDVTVGDRPGRNQITA